MSELILFEREDGYKEISYKCHTINYWEGTYLVLNWFRDNEFKTLEKAKIAIDEEVRR